MRGSGPGSVWEPGLEHAVKTEPLVTDTRGLSSRRLTIRKKIIPVISLIKPLFSFPKLTIKFSHSSSTRVMGFLFFVVWHPHTGLAQRLIMKVKRALHNNVDIYWAMQQCNNCLTMVEDCLTIISKRDALASAQLEFKFRYAFRKNTFSTSLH